MRVSDVPPPTPPGPPTGAGGGQFGGSPVPPPPPPNLTPPPGYAAYNIAPVPQTQLRRIKGVATATMILTGVAGVGAVITAITTPGATDSAQDYLAGRISEDQFLDDYTAFGLTQSLQSIATIATAVLTIIWLYRIAANVRALGRATTWAPLWAVFGWILPPVLIVIPFLMVREMWKASDATAPPDPTSWKKSPDNPLIWVWFVVYGILPAVITGLSAGAALNAGFSQNADDLAETLDDFGTLQTASALATVVAAVVWILVVRQLTARHTQLTDER